MNRSLGLDALRGIAILGMIFSWIFPHNKPWPGFMFHAQVGPPDFTYTPDIPGITWVDLVFPFFLFSMGAAFPLALKKVEGLKFSLIHKVLNRGVLLVLFALALAHFSPYSLSTSETVSNIVGLIVFGCFFLMFIRLPSHTSDKTSWFIRALALVILVVTGLFLKSISDFSFSKNKSDIIILVLANMAVFGSLLWVITKHNLKLRIGFLVVIAGVRLAADETGSINEIIWNFHPSIDWLYRFDYLKYLFIVIPGTILGDYLLTSRNTNNAILSNFQKYNLIVLGFLFIAVNLIGLYERYLILNFLVNILLSLYYYYIRGLSKGRTSYIFNLIQWGIYFIILGLVFEAFDGGIKKDPSSFSFWFLTSGLAFVLFASLELISEKYSDLRLWQMIINTGKNPMIAYALNGFALVPILSLFGLLNIFDWLENQHYVLELVRPLLITLTVIFVTDFFTRKRIFWKT